MMRIISFKVTVSRDFYLCSCYHLCLCTHWSQIHECTISLSFLGIIFRVLRLEVTVYNVYITNSFKAISLGGGGAGGVPLVEVTVNTKEDYCPNYVQYSASVHVFQHKPYCFRVFLKREFIVTWIRIFYIFLGVGDNLSISTYDWKVYHICTSTSVRGASNQTAVPRVRGCSLWSSARENAKERL